jgi:hypothetical protein
VFFNAGGVGRFRENHEKSAKAGCRDLLRNPSLVGLTVFLTVL